MGGGGSGKVYRKVEYEEDIRFLNPIKLPFSLLPTSEDLNYLQRRRCVKIKKNQLSKHISTTE